MEERRIEIPQFVVENTRLVEQKAALRREREAKVEKRNTIANEIINTIVTLIILAGIFWCIGCGIAYCFDTLIGPIWTTTPVESKATIIVSLTIVVLLGIGNLIATKKAKE